MINSSRDKRKKNSSDRQTEIRTRRDERETEKETPWNSFSFFSDHWFFVGEAKKNKLIPPLSLSLPRFSSSHSDFFSTEIRLHFSSPSPAAVPGKYRSRCVKRRDRWAKTYLIRVVCVKSTHVSQDVPNIFSLSASRTVVRTISLGKRTKEDQDVLSKDGGQPSTRLFVFIQYTSHLISSVLFQRESRSCLSSLRRISVLI